MYRGSFFSLLNYRKILQKGVIYSTPLHSTPLHSTLLYSTPLLHSTPLHSTLLYSTPFYSTPLHSTPLYSTPLYSTIGYLLVDHAVFYHIGILTQAFRKHKKGVPSQPGCPSSEDPITWRLYLRNLPLLKRVTLRKTNMELEKEPFVIYCSVYTIV